MDEVTREEDSKEVTLLLNQWADGDKEALTSLMTLLYDELRRMAHIHLRGERGDHTLQPTALVNESFLRLVQQHDVKWQNRAHFFAVASQIMRHILVDYVRRRNAAKRGGPQVKLSIEETVEIATQAGPAVDLIALDDALNTLAKMNSTHSRIVELHFFGGLSIDETAAVLGIAPRTVSHGWTLARTWLYKELNKKS